MREFLRNYVDKHIKRSALARRTRKRVYDLTQPAPNEEEAPMNAPDWTKTGYIGNLKTHVDRAIAKGVTRLYELEEDEDDEYSVYDEEGGGDNRDNSRDDSNGDENDKSERSQSIVPDEYFSDYISAGEV